jgi:hypothetical protein
MASTSSAETGGTRRAKEMTEIGRQNITQDQHQENKGEPKREKEVRIRMGNEDPNSELHSMAKNYPDSTDFSPMQDSEPFKENRISICIRKRPLNKIEMASNEVDVISVLSKDEIVVHQTRTKIWRPEHLRKQHFRLDYVFDETSSNRLVYNYTAKPLVKNILEGGMSTCFAYGQTGSGKTHTMAGGNTGADRNGLYAMAAEDIFEFLQSSVYKNLNLVISASFFEIYNGTVLDLLANKARLITRETRKRQVDVLGLTERVVPSVDELLQLIQEGSTARTAGKTWANYTSSRSHAVFQIIVRKQGFQDIHGKLSMVDLAGNERRADISCSDYQTRIEGTEINVSLLALRECMRALATNCNHIPFRRTKLTHILRDSFIGKNSKTCIIATVSPGSNWCTCSVETLRFVDRVKEQKSKIGEQLEKQRVHLYHLVQRDNEEQSSEEHRKDRLYREWQELRQRLQKRHMRQQQQLKPQHKLALASAQQQSTGQQENEVVDRMTTDKGNPTSEFHGTIETHLDSADVLPVQDTEPLKESRHSVCSRKGQLNETKVDVVSVPSEGEIVVYERRPTLHLSRYLRNRRFRFDHVFDQTSNNMLVYQYLAKPLFKNILEGGMPTRGKIHMVAGCKTEHFEFFQSCNYKNLKVVIRPSLTGTYSENALERLANKPKISVREDHKKEVQEVESSERVVDSVNEMLQPTEEVSTARTSQKLCPNCSYSRARAMIDVIIYLFIIFLYLRG